MHLDTFIVDLSLIMIVAAIVSLCFRKLKLPVVLGYIVAGFLISPHFTLLPTVVEIENITSWANIGVVFLMFALGLEFSFHKLATVGSSAIITATTVLGGMVIIGMAVGMAMGFGRMNSVFLGCMLSMSSTMIIIKSYEEFHLKQEKASTLVLGTMVVEDVGGILMIILLSTISMGTGMTGTDIAKDLAVMMLELVAWLAAGIFLIPTFLKRIRTLVNDEIMLVVAVALCFGMVLISHAIGFSEALGAFLAGSIIAGTVSGDHIDFLVRPLKDLFGAVFFVSVGMMIVPAYLLEYWWQIILLTLLTMGGQSFLATIGFLLSGQSLRTAIKGGSAMNQIGEFSFILATLGTSLGETDDFLLPMVVLVAVISIFLTPLWMKTASGRYHFLMNHMPPKVKKLLRKYTAEGRNRNDNSSDWQTYLASYFFRTLIGGSMMFLLYYAGYTWFLPLCRTHLGQGGGSSAALAGVLLLMLPVIGLMVSRRGSLHKKLWLSNPTNRLPLALLKGLQFLLAAFFVVMYVWRVTNLPMIVLVPISLVLVAVLVRTDFLRAMGIGLEARFLANYNEKILHADKRAAAKGKGNAWIGDKIHVVRFGLSEVGLCTTIQLLVNEQRDNDVLIIKIVRDGVHNNMPQQDTEICTGDILYALAGKEQLEGYVKSLERAEHIREPEEEPIALKDFIYSQAFQKIPPEDQIYCSAIPLTKDMPFSGKTVRNCGFKQNYNGFIVAIERNNLVIVDPSAATFLRSGDLIWVVGGQKMGERLLHDGILPDKGADFRQ